jgi:hypothetical protein
MMRQFFSDSHDCWPHIMADIETNANLRALRERAFEIRDAPTAEATARWKQRNNSERRRNAPVHIHQSRQACSAHPPENGAPSEARGQAMTDFKEVDKLMLELVCAGLSDWETAAINLAKHI